MKSKLLIAIHLTLLSGVFSAGHSQSLPSFAQSEAYTEARSKLLASGWQKVTKYEGASDPCKSANASQICYLYPEYDESSSDGYCRFIWSNIDGRKLAIASYPCIRRDPGNVTGWSWHTKS